MVDIKPDEISAILKSQLSNLDVESNLEEIGTVLQVGDGIARVYGLSNVSSGELVEFENGVKAIALNLEEDNVGVVLMGESGDIKEGNTVKRTGKIASIKVGDGLAGRVINTLGEPIDGRGPITGELYEMPLERKAPGVIFREPVKQPLQTGIKAIDAMIPIGRGQRELVIGDRQTLGAVDGGDAADVVWRQSARFDRAAHGANRSLRIVQSSPARETGTTQN